MRMAVAILLMLAGDGCVSVEAGAESSTRPSPIYYRVVIDHQTFWGGKPDAWDRGFDISVDRWLGPDEVGRLVCRLVEDLEIPDTCRRLSLKIHHRLDDVGVLVRARNYTGLDRTMFRERWIGGYLWSEGYAEQKGGGTIELRKDGAGKSIDSKLSFAFDHRRCGRRESEVEIVHVSDALFRPVPVPVRAGTPLSIWAGATARFRLHFGRRGGVERVEPLEVVADSPGSLPVGELELGKEAESALAGVLRLWPTLQFEPFQWDLDIGFGVEDQLAANQMLYELDYGPAGPDRTTVHPRRVMIQRPPECTAVWSGALALPPVLEEFRGLSAEFRARFLTRWRGGYAVGLRAEDVEIRTPHDPLPPVPDLRSDIELWAWTTLTEWRSPEWKDVAGTELEVVLEFRSDSTLDRNTVFQLVEYQPVGAGSPEMYPARIVIRAAPADTDQWRKRIGRYREHEEWLRRRSAEPGFGLPE